MSEPTPTPTTTAVATAKPTAVAARQPKQTIEQLLTGAKFEQKLAALLPAYMPPKTFVQIVCTQMRKTPLLAKCEPMSFFARLQECAERGLSPNGRHAYLLPFKNNKAGTVECQLVVGYQGLSLLAKKFGGVTSIYCELWFEKDTLENDTGNIRHIINYRADRRDPATNSLGVVCVVKFKDGTSQGIVVPKYEIDTVRDRAQSYKRAKQYGTDCPWMTDYGEMAKKTAFRRLAKWLDLSPEFDSAVDLDNEDYIEVKSETIDITPKAKELPPTKAKPVLAAPSAESEGAFSDQQADEGTGDVF